MQVSKIAVSNQFSTSGNQKTNANAKNPKFGLRLEVKHEQQQLLNKLLGSA
jgi:hypothetical protein